MTELNPRHFLLLIGLGLVAGVILATCTPAYAQSCETPLASTLETLQQSDPSTRVVEYGENGRRTLAANYNARPPVSNIEIDNVVSVLTARRPGMAMMVVANNGCILDYGWITLEELADILAGQAS